MDTKTLPFKVRQCFKCLGAIVYFCPSCPCGLCLQCKETHGYDIKTMNHNVVLYSRKGEGISTQDEYVKLSGMENEESLDSSTEHRNSTKYYTEQQNQKDTVNTIRGEALFYTQVLLRETKDDVKTCHKEFSIFQSDMIKRVRRLKDRLDVLRDVNFKHRCLKQKTKMYSHISKIQRYEHTRYEYSSNKPVQFLLNKTRIPQIKFSPSLTLHTRRFFMTDSLNKEDVSETLIVFQVKERGNRRVENDRLLKLMTEPEIIHSFYVPGVEFCTHISAMKTDCVLVNDSDNLILINKTGVSLYHFKGFVCPSLYFNGVHSVNSENDVIFLDPDYKISKLSIDMKITTTYIEKTNYKWSLQCVYWSLSSEDLLVGTCTDDPRYPKKGKVVRYNQARQLIQTIQHDDSGLELYKNPSYITENNNGDVVVSDWFRGAVVVTDCRGRYRFSYAQNPSGSKIFPRGICTDALLNILLCELFTNTIQVLNKDGQFLSHLLIRPSGIFSPISLSYVVSTHCLWVGSSVNNRVCGYRYIDRQDVLIDQGPAAANDVETTSEILTPTIEKPKERHDCLLKLMSRPRLLHSITLTNVQDCCHISQVTSDRVWISDRDNLDSINKTGDTLHHLKNLIMDFPFAVHTVNRESELFYIRVSKENRGIITKLSNDMTTNTDFIVTKDSTWKPKCVFWSPSTEDLLIGMTSCNQMTSKVVRYNKIGRMTQVIEHDNSGLELYKDIWYITENTNGDIVVSDVDLFSGAVVVTERGGRYRFSYTGHPPGSEIRPRGICTDILSHILVCDDKNETVHILNGDGQLISYISSKFLQKAKPLSLSYDHNTHRLWVGSKENKLYVIQYMTDQAVLTEEHAQCPAGDSLSSLTQI